MPGGEGLAGEAGKIRMSSLTHDEDGVPMKWLQLMNGGRVKGTLAEEERKEVMEICKKLEKKGKHQKAANLIYYCVAGAEQGQSDNNNTLRREWNRYINITNEELREDIKRKKEEAQRLKAMPLDSATKASPSESQRWRELEKKVGMLPINTQRWHRTTPIPSTSIHLGSVNEACWHAGACFLSFQGYRCCVSADFSHGFGRCECRAFSQGVISKEEDPNWHMKKLKPWKVRDAMALGHKYKQNAAGITDPFKKVFELEEACKMFNRVLEAKPGDPAAAGALNSCCADMNTEYVRMKKIKISTKMSSADGPILTLPGDFLRSKNEWVKAVRKR